jgi:hypothetical protein
LDQIITISISKLNLILKIIGQCDVTNKNNITSVLKVSTDIYTSIAAIGLAEILLKVSFNIITVTKNPDDDGAFHITTVDVSTPENTDKMITLATNKGGARFTITNTESTYVRPSIASVVVKLIRLVSLLVTSVMPVGTIHS